MVSFYCRTGLQTKASFVFPIVLPLLQLDILKSVLFTIRYNSEGDAQKKAQKETSLGWNKTSFQNSGQTWSWAGVTFVNLAYICIIPRQAIVITYSDMFSFTSVDCCLYRFALAWQSMVFGLLCKIHLNYLFVGEVPLSLAIASDKY